MQHRPSEYQRPPRQTQLHQGNHSEQAFTFQSNSLFGARIRPRASGNSLCKTSSAELRALALFSQWVKVACRSFASWKADCEEIASTASCNTSGRRFALDTGCPASSINKGIAGAIYTKVGPMSIVTLRVIPHNKVTLVTITTPT